MKIYIVLDGQASLQLQGIFTSSEATNAYIESHEIDSPKQDLYYIVFNLKENDTATNKITVQKYSNPNSKNLEHEFFYEITSEQGKHIRNLMNDRPLTTNDLKDLKGMGFTIKVEEKFDTFKKESKE